MATNVIKICALAIFVWILSGCSGQSVEDAQGYIEGRYTYMATSVSGILKELLVARGTEVKQGQLLFVLDEEPELDLYNAAQENLKQSVAARDAVIPNVEYSKLMMERYQVLVPKNAIQQSTLDNAKALYHSNEAQLAQAEATIASSTATLAQTKWTKDQKRVYAPVDAIVFDTYYRLGEYTEANQAILSLLAPADIKAIFYIREKDLGKVRLGETVTVTCDGCKTGYPAKISFISPSAEYTPPVIYSETTSPKLIYRIEAEFAPIDAIQMHPGQPVIVKFNRT